MAPNDTLVNSYTMQGNPYSKHTDTLDDVFSSISSAMEDVFPHICSAADDTEEFSSNSIVLYNTTPESVSASEDEDEDEDEEGWYSTHGVQILMTLMQMIDNDDVWLRGFSTFHLDTDYKKQFPWVHHIRTVHLNDFAPNTAVVMKKRKKTIALDIDGTLVHASDTYSVHHSSTFGVGLNNTPVYIIVRPFAHNLIESLSAVYDVVLYTAGNCSYAQEIARIFDPQKKFISAVYTDKHCSKLGLPIGKVYVKNLSVLKTQMSDVAIVDNSVLACSMDLNNLVPINTFSGDMNDCELLKLKLWLMDIEKADDLRTEIVKAFGTEKRILDYVC